jgi:hypothetical protein
MALIWHNDQPASRTGNHGLVAFRVEARYCVPQISISVYSLRALSVLPLL